MDGNVEGLFWWMSGCFCFVHCDCNTVVFLCVSGSWAQKPKSWEWDFWSGMAKGNVRLFFFKHNLLLAAVPKADQQECWVTGAWNAPPTDSFLCLRFLGWITSHNSFYPVCRNMCNFSYLGRIPSWPRLHRLGPEVWSPYRTAYTVNKPWSWVSPKCYRHSRGERPQHLTYMHCHNRKWSILATLLLYVFINLYIYFYSCCMWNQRSLRAPTMLCYYAPHSPRPRKWMWIAPSCQMEPSSPPSPLFSPDSKWSAAQVGWESNCDTLWQGGRGFRWQCCAPR